MAMFICSDCGNRSTKGGDCSACGQGPLLDLADPSVTTAIREADVQRQLKRERLLRVVAVPIAAVPVLAIVFAAPWLLLLIPLPIPFAEVIKVIVAIILVAFPVSKGLTRVFRAKSLLGENDGPSASTADVAAAMRSGGTKRILLTAGVIVGIGVLLVAAVTYMRVSEARARARQAAAMSALRTCLLGDLDAGESVSDRLRKLQLSAGAVEPVADWPDRCAKHGDALFGELEDQGTGAHLKELLAAKAKCATGCQADGLFGSIQEIVTASVSARIGGDELGFVASPETAGPPLAEMTLLRARDFRVLAQKELVLIDSTVLTDGRAALLYRTPGAKLHVCEVEPGTGQTACAPVPESVRVAVSAAKLARGESEPVVYGITAARVTGGRDALGNERNPEKKGEAQKTEVERGAFSARTGERVPFFHGANGEGRRDGVLLEGRGATAEAVVIKDGQEASRRSLGPSVDASGPWVVDDTIVFTSTDSDGKHILYSRGAFDSKARSAGSLPGGASEPPLVCRAGQTTSLVLGGRLDTAVSFLGKSGLTAPVAAPVAVRVGPEAPAPRPKKPPPPEPSSTSSAGASAAPATSDSATGRYGVKGPSDNPDPQAARAQALKDAAEFGMLGLLNSGAGGDPNAPTAPWGRDSLGSGFGSGGLGSSAFGTGGLGGRGRSSNNDRADAAPEARQAMIDNAEVSCSGDAVTRTWLGSLGAKPEVHQVRCTAESCAHEVTTLHGLTVRSTWVVTTLGGKVLLVYRGELGDLRMRMAPLAELSTARDTVIMDSSEYGGPETGEPHVLASAAAVTFLFRGEGLFGLRITADGKHGIVGRRE